MVASNGVLCPAHLTQPCCDFFLTVHSSLSRERSISTRAAVAAHLRSSRTLPLAPICKLADWSGVSVVYEKFYHSYL